MYGNTRCALSYMRYSLCLNFLSRKEAKKVQRENLSDSLLGRRIIKNIHPSIKVCQNAATS